MSLLHHLLLAVLIGVQGINAYGQGKRSHSPRVRILSWWGYIDSKDAAIQGIEKKCRTTLSVDEFYSTTEFLSRLAKRGDGGKPYDVLIYSDTAYNAKETALARNSKKKILTQQSAYSASISSYYKRNKYNSATGIFQISLSGFLANKSLIQLRGIDSLAEIFKRAGNNISVLMDDHMEIATLLNKWECSETGSNCGKNSQLIFPSEDKLKKLVGQAKVVISSDLAEITKHPKFALAYTWSGDAIQKTISQPNLEFILHPSLSHTSMDLLTLVGESQEARCVANELTSKKFVDSVAQKSRYFSPFGPVESTDKTFTQLQTEFFKQFSSLGRIHRVTQNESLEIDKKWQIFKILFGSKI